MILPYSGTSNVEQSITMPVPNSPQMYRRVIPVEPPPEKDEDFEIPMTKPPKPIYTSKYDHGKYTSGVEAFLNDDGSSRARKTSLTSAGGYHRSRERTRQSAVQRLVERKLAQKEKEREKERDRSWGSIASNNVSSSNGGFSIKSFPSTSPNRSDIYQRDRSGTRSENGFMLGAGRSSSPSKENIEPDYFEQRVRRTARSCSGTRYRDGIVSEEPITKTYITIEPGKPTRIREHSPSKSAKLSTDETVTSARERSAQSRNSSPLKVFDLNRSISPSPQRKTREYPATKAETRSLSPDKKKEFLRNTSPLKSTNILKTCRASKEETDFNDQHSEFKKRSSQPFTTEKTFLVNHSNNNSKSNLNNNKLPRQSERRLSIEILNCVYRADESDKERASPDSEGSGSSSVSSFSSPLSGSSDSVESNDKSPNIHLSQRRISLEQRFQARARINSPERPTVNRKVSEVKTSYSSTKSTTINASSEFIFRKSSSRTNSEFRKYSRDSSGSNLNNLSNLNKPIPASRKISLPQTAGKRPEPAPRRRSLNTILSPERLADEKKEEGNQLYKLKQYRDALSKYSEAIDLCPQCVSFYGNRSACYLMLGQPRQALEDARTSTTLDMEFTKGWTRFARCCVLLGDTVSARQALTKLGDLGEDNPAEQKNIEMVEKMVADSQQAYQGKDYRKSLYCLDKALGVSTHSLTIKTSRAECLAFLGRYTEAAEAANSVLQLDNMNADAIYVRGLCLYYEDNVDRAFSHFTQVLRFAPDHVKAKEIYKKAKSLKNKKEEGNAAFKAGKLDEAYKLYSDALQIDPFNRTTNAKLYFNRATVASKLKKTAESISDCDKALDLDPNYTKALLRRAKTYMETEQYDDAVRDYENLMKNDRGNMEYRQLLQTAKLELKKSKRKDFYKILGVDKNANEEEIKKAYRKRAMVHHPDRHSGATEAEQKDHEHKFKEVGEAYAVLSDEKKRRMYDSGQDLEDGGGQGFNDVDPNSIFQAFFGGGGMGGHPGMGGGGGGHGGHGGQHFQFAGANPGAQSFSFQFG